MFIRKIQILLFSTGLIFGFAAFNCSNFGDYESESDSESDNEDDDSSGSTGTTCVITTTGTGNALFYVLSPAHTAASSHGGTDHSTALSGRLHF